jgi:glycosyltransferase involved in cell wall biosynthesis
VAPDSIAVVTLTRHRPEMLRRALAAVAAQDYAGPIEHVIVIDDEPDTVPLVEAAPRRPGLRVVPHLVRRTPEETGPDARHRRSAYPRMARLFNTGVRVASSRWISFLDDDNEYEPNHLSSLYAVASARGVRAVHSARQMVWADGSPYLDEVFPSAPNPEEGVRIYELMCERGVWIRGTNILQDQVDPVQTTFRNSTVIGPDDPTFLVDQNVWLIERDLILELPIPETFTEADIEDNTCPDDKMLEVLVRNNVTIVPTGLPTVRYYLGGASNRQKRPTPVATE